MASACENAYETWLTSPNQDLVPVIFVGIGQLRMASVIFFFRWHYTVGCYSEASKLHFVFCELKFIGDEDNCISATVGNVFKSVPKSRLYGFVPDKAIVNAASFSGCIHRNILESASVSIPRRVKTLGCSEVPMTAQFCYECGCISRSRRKW